MPSIKHQLTAAAWQQCCHDRGDSFPRLVRHGKEQDLLFAMTIETRNHLDHGNIHSKHSNV